MNHITCKKIIGFDTFSGFPSISKYENKGNKKLAKLGGFAKDQNYDKYLEKYLIINQLRAPQAMSKDIN